MKMLARCTSVILVIQSARIRTQHKTSTAFERLTARHSTPQMIKGVWSLLAGQRGRNPLNPVCSLLAAQRAMSSTMEVDPAYPGTSVERLRNIQARVRSLVPADLSKDWEEVRRKLLWAGGLKDLPQNVPGQGYTGHSFNDDNHCDLTPMLGEVAHNLNNGEVSGIAQGNRLGPGIDLATLPELGVGGSWSTCTNGCHLEPPQDVAHVQFRSRIAFKLVWCPPEFSSFVLVDDSGAYLNHGSPSGALPDMRMRRSNFQLVKGSKYALEAEGFKSRPEPSVE
ncbi:unnamed protein product [Polarella glacialis]|uniref:Uncharacterized protein n=1 Tax=Polarella glacialis TaxID=89957 RepID=A0A813GAX3_POLGL|nr:unnamed protein product [Polarella glacialis]